uniref:Acid phosphatase n=1 Tax=Caenorhabditis japonica TaxID=281687 RepID=A0A8R1HRH7_CAEJA
MDWILICLIFITLYAVIKYKNDANGETITGEAKPNWQSEDIREMCQFLEHEVTGQEGDLWAKLRLRGLTIVFRHGERSPLSAIEDDTGCIPYRYVDRKNFIAYKQLAESDGVVNFLKLDPELQQYPRYPLYAKCVRGMLSAEGALQHVRLGKYFRHRYEKTRLFTDENQRIVADVVSSKYNRTVQSALAFSTEFLYKQRALLTPIQIKASNFSYHCIDPSCVCDINKEIRETYEDEFLAEFHKMKSDDVAEEEKRILSFDALSQSFHPFEMIDVALGKYVCRRRPLPCHGNDCLTFDTFNKVINLTTLIGSRMFDERIGVARRLQSMEAYPILSYLKDSIEKIRKFPHSNYIQIFSGHDVTVAPILRTLGVPFVDPPHYTSRIVFEIYEHSDEGLFVRVLYNGHNRSFDVRFCQGENLKYGMCRAKAFEEFVKKGLFELAGVSEFKDFCHN